MKIESFEGKLNKILRLKIELFFNYNNFYKLNSKMVE